MRVIPFLSLGKTSSLIMCRVDGNSGTCRKTTSACGHIFERRQKGGRHSHEKRGGFTSRLNYGCTDEKRWPRKGKKIKRTHGAHRSLLEGAPPPSFTPWGLTARQFQLTVESESSTMRTRPQLQRDRQDTQSICTVTGRDVGCLLARRASRGNTVNVPRKRNSPPPPTSAMLPILPSSAAEKRGVFEGSTCCRKKHCFTVVTLVYIHVHLHTSSSSTNSAPRSASSETSPAGSTHKSLTPKPRRMLLKHCPICFFPRVKDGQSGRAG